VRPVDGPDPIDIKEAIKSGRLKPKPSGDVTGPVKNEYWYDHIPLERMKHDKKKKGSIHDGCGGRTQIQYWMLNNYINYWGRLQIHDPGTVDPLDPFGGPAPSGPSLGGPPNMGGSFPGSPEPEPKPDEAGCMNCR